MVVAEFIKTLGVIMLLRSGAGAKFSLFRSNLEIVVKTLKTYFFRIKFTFFLSIIFD